MSCVQRVPEEITAVYVSGMPEVQEKQWRSSCSMVIFQNIEYVRQQ